MWLEELSQLAVAASVANTEAQERRREFSHQCRLICQGWGQTKVVEDGIGELRQLETRAVSNRVVDFVGQWDHLRPKGLVVLH